MADQEPNDILQEVTVSDESGHSYVAENRRYVGRKETIGYVVWDMSQTFNIDGYRSRFATNILQVDLGYQEIFTIVNGIWDVVNDVFTGAIIDRTRTRWGKFKPYLVLLAGPGMILSCLYWLLPLLFPNLPAADIGKFVAYMVLGIISEGVGTFKVISQTGLVTTITPHPVDRTRLITLANFFSGFLGEKLPDQILTVLTDLIDNGILKPKAGQKINMLYQNIYVGMGMFTSIASGLASLWFCLIARERVMQSIERPSIRQGIRSIVTNKPILLMTLESILSDFGLGGSKRDYYIEVLKWASMEIVAGAPGGLVHPVSYLIVPWAKRKFPSKWLYIISKHFSDVLLFLVFLFGSIGGIHKGLYKKRLPMLFAMMIYETLFMVFYGIRKVIPTEMQNEAMDYCEWKNGYRTEAMTGVAKDLAKKMAGILSNALSLRVKKLVGYDQTRYVKGQKQDDKTQYFLFATFAGVPMIISMISVIPMLFYDLDGEKKERMYSELIARRAAVSRAVTSGDAEAVARAAEAQMHVGDKE